MTLSTLDAVRVNHSTWSWSSVAFHIDGQASEGLQEINWEDELEARVVPSNLQDGPPLGMSAGRYRVARLPMVLLRDSALALKNYLSAKAITQGVTSYGQATFDMSIQLSGQDSPNLTPTTTVFATCRIVGERPEQDVDTGVLVTEFQVACLLITEGVNSLWNALETPIGGMPWADTITVANVPAPGKWTLLRAPKVFGWDVRKGTALSGATVVPVGDELVSPRFLVEVWTPTDYAAFKAFRSQFLKKALVAQPGSPIAMALGIDHPELKEMGVSSVVVREINPLLNDGFGVGMCEIEFLQYRKPLPALSKPNAAIPDVTPPAPTAQTQVQRELQQAQAELQAVK